MREPRRRETGQQRRDKTQKGTGGEVYSRRLIDRKRKKCGKKS